jgi:serine/threonine protein kinase
MSMIGEYIVLETLGEGGQGIVKLGEAKDGKKVALKLIDKKKIREGTKAFENMMNEAKAMHLLDHKHIVKLFEEPKDVLMPTPEG